MKVHLYAHPFAEGGPQVFEVASLAEWLLQRYEGKPAVPYDLFEGEPSATSRITGNADAILQAKGDLYTVLESPGDPINIMISMAVSMVVGAIARRMFAPDPSLLANRDQESPNNQLSDRQNRVRLMERVEDIYGTDKAIPSLLMPTYRKYINHRQVEFGYYCVGRGYYDISNVKDGDTLLSEITEASAAVFPPFTSPNSGSPQLEIGDTIIDPILTVRRASGAAGITLKAANQLQITAGLSYFFRGPGGVDGELPATGLDVIYQPSATSRRPNFAAVSENGQSLTVSMANTARTRSATVTVVGATKTFHGPAGFFLGVVNGTSVPVASSALVVGNTGTFTVVSHTNSSLTVAEALTDDGGAADFTLQINYSGTRTISAVENGYVTLTGASQYSSIAESFTADLVVDNGLTDWTDWFTLPATDREEVWTNVVAPLGMYKDDGSKQSTSVTYEVQIEQLTALLVPTGTVETVTGNLDGATSNERAETLERVTAWTGPARVRNRRTTPFDYDFAGAVVDEIRLMDVYSVSPVSKPHFGNKTTVHTVTPSTTGATAVRTRELNCIAARKLPTYNGTTFSGAFDADGALVSGTISATNRMVDIIAAVSIDPKIGALDIADLDMAQIWATQQALDAWHTEAGQFNCTLDTDALSYEETIFAIAHAAFCEPYRQNGRIRLSLDRPQSTNVAVFTHRNKRPDAETITRRFANDGEYDGIELVYQDPDTEKPETIRLPLDGSFTKLKKVEVMGVRSYEQAWFHANREYARLLFQRIAIVTDATTDARALLPNSRIAVVDNTRIGAADGEVIAQDGLTITLSREVEFIPATPHSIWLIKRDGSPQSIACTAGPEANQVVLATPPAEALVTTPSAEEGIRTIFSFAPDSARAAMAYLVRQLRPTEDGKFVRIEAVNYAPEYYAADEDAIPDKAGVIN